MSNHRGLQNEQKRESNSMFSADCKILAAENSISGTVPTELGTLTWLETIMASEFVK